jgi:predicted DNA-binding transcriptional regulator YafY
MATNKNAQIRYKILDNCFRNTGKRYFIEDLIQKCDSVLTDIDPNFKGISRRQIFDDIAFMESSEGWEIELIRERENKRIYYHYADSSFSINNMPLNETEINRLLTTLHTLSKFKGMPQFEWMSALLPKLSRQKSFDYPDVVMEFDNNPYLMGIEHIGIIYDAIINKQVLKITYLQSFENKSYLTIHPYYLKQYNSRWFLFGYNPEQQRYNWNVALDRIKKINVVHDSYISNTEIDWDEYFEDILGVTKPLNHEPEKIVLQFYGKTAYYIESKPIHGSQKSQWLGNDTLQVELELIINYELERFILSYADSVRVIQPQSLIEQIKSRMGKGFSQYEQSNI